MAANKPKRNKTYKPRPIILNAIEFVRGGYKPVRQENLQKLALNNHGAMAAIAEGRGDLEHWKQLTGAVNIALIMCEMGIAPEYLPLANLAQDALVAMGKRNLQIGRWVFKADELKVLNELFEVHEAQLAAARVIDIERATDIVKERLRGRCGIRDVDWGDSMVKEAA